MRSVLLCRLLYDLAVNSAEGGGGVALVGVDVHRESGDVAGTPGLKMVGPAGEIDCSEGAIIAKRHIHMTPADAEGLGVTNGEVVKVLVKSERTTIFDDVVVRVSPSYALAMHIDTDECNAAAAFGEIYGEIVK